MLLFRRNLVFTITLILGMLLLAACNLPERQAARSQTPTAAQSSVGGIDLTATPTSTCENPYFPSTAGDSWEYSGTNSTMGTYTRSDTITNSGGDTFTLRTSQADLAYSVVYSCSPAGLMSADPIQQYVAVLLNSPNAPVSVKLTSNTGISLPATINPGDTWQQSAGWEATSQDLNLNGMFVFDYTAVGYETVVVPYGTFQALRVDANIRIEVSGLRILAGTYTATFWMARDIGIIKSEGISHIPEVEYSDSIELTSFTPSQ